MNLQRQMFKYLLIFIFLFLNFSDSPLFASGLSVQQTDAPLEGLELLDRVIVNNNGRLKPFHTLARETLLLVYGNWSLPKQTSTESYLFLLKNLSSINFPILELRSQKLRELLGFTADHRYVSLNEIRHSPLFEIAKSVPSSISNTNFPTFNLPIENLSTIEQEIQQAVTQATVLGQWIRGDHLMEALHFNNPKDRQVALRFLTFLQDPSPLKNEMEFLRAVKKILWISQHQDVPEILQHAKSKIELEIVYNKVHPFLWSSILFLILGFLIILLQRGLLLFSLLPFGFLLLGILMRVYITQFAPITNMYGTLIWVAMGVSIFAAILYVLYKNSNILAIAYLCSGTILLISEKIPLVLTPNMDPIVAVLRSNFWLSTHVTTITISYAAYTLALALCNITLVKLWIHEIPKDFLEKYSLYVYRLIQIGCFFLTLGIILGGIWADNTWGRFWDWDPKETWALIADLGFLALLHARLIGWVRPFSLILWTPLAYLLVIMAWFGVNFLLTTGLHTYGFSSGGASVLIGYVLIQLGFLALAFLKYQKSTI